MFINGLPPTGLQRQHWGPDVAGVGLMLANQCNVCMLYKLYRIILRIEEILTCIQDDHLVEPLGS
jgi:hypothetical protein